MKKNKQDWEKELRDEIIGWGEFHHIKWKKDCIEALFDFIHKQRQAVREEVLKEQAMQAIT